jgi:8-amino-7-oxononanoate synthase
LDKKLHRKITDRVEKGTLRSLSSFEGYIDFYSNDYLGMSKEKIFDFIAPFGSTGSRLISGNSLVVMRSEEEIAEFFSAEASLMFNSGYDANMGFFSAVPQRGDTVIYDELIHASVRDGIRMGLARGISFKHNDVNDLEEKIKRSGGVVYVAVESLYSMDGDFACLKEISRVCERYNVYLIVDEAHSTGVIGDHGRGEVDRLGLNEKVFARVVTFGKAYGSHGACVLSGNDLKTYLYNFARSFIYTTALPPYVYAYNSAATRFKSIPDRQEKLREVISVFRKSYKGKGLISDERSPIQVIEIGDIQKTKDLAKRLQIEKIAVKPIFSPTVPEGKERIRLCFHAENTENEVELLVKILNE